MFSPTVVAKLNYQKKNNLIAVPHEFLNQIPLIRYLWYVYIEALRIEIPLNIINIPDGSKGKGTNYLKISNSLYLSAEAFSQLFLQHLQPLFPLQQHNIKR